MFQQQSHCPKQKHYSPKMVKGGRGGGGVGGLSKKKKMVFSHKRGQEE
jgi:hypothetical protein